MARIEVTDTQLDYISIPEARKRDGLRIVQLAAPVPAPWGEACRNVFHAKGLKWTLVRSANEGASELTLGQGGGQSDLRDWTGQSSVPVVAWNDEPPVSNWLEQLHLAERLAPEPRLIPADMSQRIFMIGLINELVGRDGINVNRRYLMTHVTGRSFPEDHPGREMMEFLGRKYHYDEAAGERASDRVVEVLARLDSQLEAQRARGSKFFIGDSLTALDLYWCGSCGFLSPMDEARCPMATDFREVFYGPGTDAIAAALTPELIAHRDFIYDEYLELPIRW